MAEDDPWRRLREREDEREELEEQSLQKRRTANLDAAKPSDRSAQAANISNSYQLDMLINGAEKLIEQLNSLYNLYLAGIERLPPNQRRRDLDVLVKTILGAPKPTTGSQFRANTLLGSYNVNKDKWDRQLRDVEAGKIKRPTRPGR